MNDVWDWGYAFDTLPLLLDGLLTTFLATLFGSVLAFVLGLVLAVIRRSGLPVISQATWGFIEFVRSTPLLVQLFFLFFVLPDLGIVLPSFGETFSSGLLTGILGLGLHYSTYAAEVYRAGIEAVPAGQWEAAAALSLPRSRVWTGVVLPQAVPRVLPALGNYVISMFKETPLLLGIGVLDLVGAAREVGADTFRFVEPITIAGVFFLLLSYPSSVLVRRLERRFGHV